MFKLKKIVASMKRACIVKETADYLHVEITMRLIRCVDDVEFYFGDRDKLIHVRSASRVGYSDWGANRKRVEWVRERFQALV